MKVYISGISGTGMGPLALMAKQAGLEVVGSDLFEGAIYHELVEAGIEVSIGKQDGEFLNEKLKEGVDWFVYTSALPETHAELIMAKKAGIKYTKRDDFTAYLVEKLDLKMIAVAGTHGKTTTTAMIVWVALKLGLPVAYIVGTTLGFAPSGRYQEGDKYFVYEADEYDRNFLKFHPWVSVITCVSYDHPDIYKTKQEYESAFSQFMAQSERVIDGRDESIWGIDAGEIDLAGEARRKDAGLAVEAIASMLPDGLGMRKKELIKIVNEFPGVGRRFERICDGVYTDYAHHPEEIAATLNVAKDEAKRLGKKGVVVLYQPHQNSRQHEVKSGYKDAFFGAEKVYWLPTYLTREDPDLEILTPEDLIQEMGDANIAEPAELGDDLANKLHQYVDDEYLVILMTAGPADQWFREAFA